MYAENLRNVPQSQPAHGKPMDKNAAGGYTFNIDHWARLRRFLILGCEGGTYYEGENQLTHENADTLAACLNEDFQRTIDLIVEVSDRGLAPKNDAAIFALAYCTVFGDKPARNYAFHNLNKVCRIGTHLFYFVASREAMGGGWGRGMREAVERWYDRDDIVNQALKYKTRHGWSHRDVLRLAHPKTDDDTTKAIFDAVVKDDWSKINHPWACGVRELADCKDAQTASNIVDDYDIPRELVPTEHLNSPQVWEALLPNMPMTAMIRNLGKMGAVGLLKPMSPSINAIFDKLTDPIKIRHARVHPFSVLLAAKTYAQGHGVRGSLAWTPVPQILEALNTTFEYAFHNVVSTNQRILLGVDVSSSMSWGSSIISPAEAAAAVAMIIARTEPQHYIMGFSTQFVDLGITARDSLPNVLAKTSNRNFGGTNTSVAIQWAQQHCIEVDAFVTLTDNETWAGDKHTFIALEEYRRRTGIASKHAVCAFSPTRRSIADGSDPLSMDFVGLDSSLPQALAAFLGD